MNNTEIWKDIPQYKGFYQASNFGNIRSLDRQSRNGSNTYTRKGRQLTPCIEGSGYLQVLIQIGGIVRKHMKVHRLVAFAFMPNPENKLTVNHKNGIKTDNKLENLEWATHSENLIHALSTGLKKPQQLGKSGALHHLSKGVYTTKDGIKIEYGSIRECARALNVHPAAVSKAIVKNYNCRGHQIFEERKLLGFPL